MNKKIMLGLIVMILLASSLYVQSVDLQTTLTCQVISCNTEEGGSCTCAEVDNEDGSVGNNGNGGIDASTGFIARLNASYESNQLSNVVTITFVNLTITWQEESSGTSCTIDIFDGTSYVELETGVSKCPGTTKSNYSRDITSILDTETKIELSKIRINYTRSNPQRYLAIDLVNITVNYTTDTVKPRLNASIFNVSAPTKGDVVNFTANVSDDVGLDTCQFFMNGTSDGSFIILNKSVTSTDDQCSQNWTIDLTRGNVINFTALINDTSNNINLSVNRSDGGVELIGQIITIANFIPTPTIVSPANDLKTNLQTLNLNVTFEEDRDNDVINISYYIDGKLNQTHLGLNTTFNASDGFYILNVTLFDNVTGTSYSSNVTVNFTIDTIKPNVTLISPENYFNSSSENITFNFNVTDERSTQNINCSIYIDDVLNATNSSTLNGTNSSFIIINITESVHTWNVTCIDEAGNSNTSILRNFTVDLTNPALNKISFTPNTTAGVDPDVLLNFTINATDSGSAVKTVVLLYQEAGAATFKSDTARLDADGLYYANFTPDTNNINYTYRINASDHAGNINISDPKNISVEEERTWKRIPATFDNLACGFSKTCTAGNLTINNTGDRLLTFDLSSNFGDTSFNITEPFDLEAKEVKYIIEINLTAGSSAAESNVVLTIDATTGGADPDSDTTNFTFTASAGGPVFDVTIVGPPTEANKSDPGVLYLNASLKNIGNETAGFTYVNWTLPTNWLNISGTNLTKNFTNVSVNEIVYHNITVNLTSSASTGTQKVNVTAASNNSASDSAAASIVVTETSTGTTSTTTTTTGGGGGGGGGTGGGGGSAPVVLKPEEIVISQVVNLVRGEDNSFTIEVTNNFTDSVLVNLTMQVEGFLSQYLSIEPEIIPVLYYNQSKEFTVTVAAPAYKGYEEHTLKALVTGMLVKTIKTQNITVTSRNPFTQKNYISLIIHEIGKETVDTSLDKAAKLIEEMQQAGYPVKKPLKLLEEAKEKLNSGRYKLAQDISNQISNIRENAFSADLLINEIKSKIREAEDKGLQVEETRKFLNLAIAAFEREDFLTAIQRTKDAQLSIVIETKGKFNVVKFVIDNWYPIILFLLIFLSFGYFIRKKVTLIIISRRLEDLQKEEVTINELMQETQENYYKHKKISTTEYHKALYGYEKRLSEVTQLISRLRSKRVGIIEISNEIKNLKKEDDNVTNLIKQLQDGYYNKQTINRKVYLKRIREYKVRRIEIERSIAVLEAKLAKKEMLEELKAKEVPKKKIISIIKKKEEKFKKIPPVIKPKSRFSLKNLFKREKKEDHPKEVNKLLDDLVKKKDKPKSAFITKKQIEPIQKKTARKIFSIKNLIEKINKKSFQKRPSISHKKEIISKLKNKFQLDTVKVKEHKKDYSRDIDSLKKHGFEINPKHITKSIAHSKEQILNKLKEVYKHD